jgi:dCMP deaminase
MPLDKKWCQRFIDLAKVVASWSKDPSTQCGAVIVNDDRQILATGYNGLPRGVDDELMYASFTTKEDKYALTVHAEMNAILNAGRFGVLLNNSVLFVYGLPPCCDCAKHLVTAGIREIYFHPHAITYNSKWEDSFTKTQGLLKRLNITCTRL